MKFSIIIPAYNAQTTIVKCLENVVSIFGHDTQIIVINDGSEDNTKDAILSYTKGNNLECIKLISNEANCGVSFSRNIGIKNATSDYMLFLDADDTLSDDFLEVMNNKITKYPNAKIIRFNIVNPLLKEFLDFEVNSYFDIPNEFLEGFYLHSSSTQLIKKDFFSDVLFEEEIIFGEDMLYSFNLLRRSNSSVFISDQLYKYSHSNDSASNNIDPNHILKILDSLKIVYEKICDHLETSSKTEIFRKKYFKELSIQQFKIKQTSPTLYRESLSKIDYLKFDRLRLNEVKNIYLLHTYFAQSGIKTLANLTSNVFLFLKRSKGK